MCMCASVCVRGPGSQDKNVFDIVCNCVMFTLLVSEGACISKQAFDCQARWGQGIPFAIHWETTRSLDAGLGDGHLTDAFHFYYGCVMTS